ncbi:MAG TPA: hypothetical protein V6C52_11295 [Coleofasciculaceae cyanobacterium]
MSIEELYKQRMTEDYNENAVIKELFERGVSQNVSACVVRYFQDWLGIRNYPILPNDKICGLYGCCEEDLEEAMLELGKSCAKREPIQADIDAFKRPIETIADLALFLETMV